MKINNKQLIFRIFHKLWPINRSITGKGFTESLKIIQKELKGLKIKKIKTNSKVFDWKIPKEWNVSEAWIKDENGKKILNYRDNNLHLMGYSKPINKLVNFKTLNSHLFSTKDQPNAIPYVTSYYNKDWGFCLNHKTRKKLDKKKKYRVLIKSKFSNGFLRYGEIIIPGKSKKEILISTYLCHPSLANNELSGPILTLLLSNWLNTIKKRNYTYRIIIIPETIGSIAYIHKNLDILKKRIIAGFVITCVGDERNFSYLPSRKENTVADNVIKKVLKRNKIKHKKYSWLERGSDERQFCSPGVDLPVASLMRTKYGEFKEYHTSLDKFGNVVTEKGILDSFRVYKKIITELEKNIYPNSLYKCEPQMSKRRLYPKISMKNTLNKRNKILSNILTYSDGSLSAEDISKKIKINYKKVLSEIKFLEKYKLIEI